MTASSDPSSPLATPASTERDRPDGAGRPHATLLFGLLGLLVLAFYYQLWWPDRVLIKRDATMVFLPIKHYLAERLREGALPEWFPHDAMGRPFIGVAVAGVFHPFTLLYMLLPTAEALRLSALLSCLLAAGGAFGLGHHLGLSAPGSLLAGFAFACSGYVASLTENIQYLYGTCLTPLILLALDKALSGGRAWLVAAAALWATVFLNGDIQTGYSLAFVALLWALMRTATAQQAVSVLAATAGLAVLLAGIQLGPSLAVYLDSNARQSPIYQEFTLQWSTHPLRLLTLLAWPVSTESDPGDVMDVFFGGPAMTPWAESLYLGAPVLGLALLGAVRRPDLRVLAVLGLLALLLALGRYGGLYEIMRQTMPLWAAFRYPEKWMGLASCTAALLAGAGLDTLRAGRHHPTPWWLAACAGLAISLMLRTTTAQTLLAVLHETSMEMAHDVARTWAGAWLVSGAAAGGLAMLLAARWKELIRTPVLLAGLLVISVVDLTAANIRAYFTAPREAAEFTPPFLRELAAREGPLAPGRFRVATLHFGGRIYWPPLLEARIGYHGAQSAHYRQALNGGLNTEFGIEGFLAALPGASRAVDEVIRLQRPEVYARMNVAYFVDIRSLVADRRLLDGLVRELPEYNLVLARNPVAAKPRVYLSRKPEPAATPPDPTALFARADFLSGDVDVIETREPLPEPAATGRAVIETYAPEHVRVRTETPSPAVLILVDAFDPGWRATLETGEVLPVCRANLLMRAVVVPAGIHRVTFTYRTPFLTAGAAASATGLFLAIAALVRARRRPRPMLIGPEEATHVPATAG